MPRQTIPGLPKLLDRKIYKTGQTRGADDDEVYQNRVLRTSTVLIPYAFANMNPPDGAEAFDNGSIVLIPPSDYFANPNLQAQGLELGRNALVFYETRDQWNAHNPDALGWHEANSRTAPLGGQYIARIPATTAVDNGEKINRGFTTTNNKGAGIRVYEYASAAVITQCRIQLEALIWLCFDSDAVAIQNGMPQQDVTIRKTEILRQADEGGLLNLDRLQSMRLINRQGHTICPLCLEELSAHGFYNRMQQAEGREVNDLTVTQLNLFHIEELRVGVFNHRPYNLGWGHHHCNVVVKDAGIRETLDWMKSVLQRNAEYDAQD